jgi:hypothetical protein
VRNFGLMRKMDEFDEIERVAERRMESKLVSVF